MNLSEQHWWQPWVSVASICSIAMISTLSAIGGCEKKEKVMEIQAPGFNLEVDKTTSPTGDKGLEINSTSDQQIEIDATKKRIDP